MLRFHYVQLTPLLHYRYFQIRYSKPTNQIFHSRMLKSGYYSRSAKQNVSQITRSEHQDWCNAETKWVVQAVSSVLQWKPTWHPAIFLVSHLGFVAVWSYIAFIFYATTFGSIFCLCNLSVLGNHLFKVFGKLIVHKPVFLGKTVCNHALTFLGYS